MSDMLPDVDVPLRCRMGACRENLDDGQSWSFYLINDTGATLDLVVLYEICSEWGDIGCAHTADKRVTNLAPGASALLWRDDGELRTELSVLAQMHGRVLRFKFEFQRLYRQANLSLVAGLNKPGLEAAVVGTQNVWQGAQRICVSSGKTL